MALIDRLKAGSDALASYAEDIKRIFETAAAKEQRVRQENESIAFRVLEESKKGRELVRASNEYLKDLEDTYLELPPRRARKNPKKVKSVEKDKVLVREKIVKTYPKHIIMAILKKFSLVEDEHADESLRYEAYLGIKDFCLDHLRNSCVDESLRRKVDALRQ